MKAEGFTLSETDLECETTFFNALLSTKIIYQYEISDSNITFTDYFDGTLPTDVSFSGEKISFTEHRMYFRLDKNDENLYFSYPTYKNGSFTGKVYKCERGDEGWTTVALGNIAGTYTTSGTGTSGCTVTLTFSELPEGITEVSTGTAYTLTN